MVRVCLIVLAGLAILSLQIEAIRAEEPLAVRIDQLIQAKATEKGLGTPANLADDAEFLRRVTLDLTGGIPTAAKVREFLADAAPDKRTRKIDELLAGPEYPRRMRELFNGLLMERLGEHAEWQKYLQASFSANKHWDQMVREMLSPDAENESARGAAFFLTKRLENYGQNPVDMPALTRDIGRLFLGVDLQCAQCHDHLFIDSYKQADFQGIYTFIASTSIRSDKPFPAVAEKPTAKKTDFISVFKKEPKSIGPKLPGLAEIEIPIFAKDQEFEVAPDRAKNFPGKLKFSPLQKLSEQLPTVDNPLFARNIANRIWAILMGRGLVHPLDLHHVDNPPSHPELLDLLAKESVSHQFDIKWLIREICLTQAYQRSSQFPEGQEPRTESFLVGIEKPLSAEQILRMTLQATGESDRMAKAAKDPTNPIPDEMRLKFLKTFANPPREPEGEYAPSVKAALFMMHDTVIQSWLPAAEDRLAQRLSVIGDANLLADELYLTVLTRQPSAEERTEISDALAKAGDQKNKALENLIWGLLASTEFCLNH
jgi:hypothetical protein